MKRETESIYDLNTDSTGVEVLFLRQRIEKIEDLLKGLGAEQQVLNLKWTYKNFLNEQFWSIFIQMFIEDIFEKFHYCIVHS